MAGGCDHSQAYCGGCGQKTPSSGENVEEIVEMNWPVSQRWMQERIGDEITNITATQIQREIVNVIELISQERISERIN